MTCLRAVSGDRVRFVLAVCVLTATTLAAEPPASRASQSAALTDHEFWRLITELSEPGGSFRRQLMSNEDSALFVIPALQDVVSPGGVYVGVGAEVNFTYVAALEPRLAFIVDIRRDNMLEMLAYKAIFELSASRSEFVSRLFSRAEPTGLREAPAVTELFDAYRAAPADGGLLERNVNAVLETLTGTRGFPLTEADQVAIRQMLEAFSAAGPGRLRGFGDGGMPTYVELLTATDRAGRERSFLASDELYALVRGRQRENRIVPVVGDFGGDKALAAIGGYLREQRAVVSVFYVSNVERYLWERPDRGAPFYANVAALPLDDSSVFIRSVITDITQRLDIEIPVGPERWRTFLAPIRADLRAVEGGRIQAYRDLFGLAR